MPEEKKPEEFNITQLSEEKRKEFEFVKTRIEQLKETRKDVYGMNIENLWQEADKNYIPHTLKTKGKRVIATDEDKGWRGTLVELGKSDDWQSDVSQANPFIKIQTAISLLIDRNPTAIFNPGSSRFEKTTNLQKNLYKRNWEIAKSIQQLKLFIFNLAKYGWSIGRTYPLRLVRKTKEIDVYNEEKPDESTYVEKEAIEYNDVFRENLDPFNCWIDDLAKPNNRFSVRDWAWRRVYALDAMKEEFGNRTNWKYVKKGGTTDEKLGIGIKKKYQEKDLVEVYFYENRLKDLFMVIANGIPLIQEPLPISDSEGNKKLSMWQTYWNLRHAETPYGIGIWEAIREDQKLLDRIRNMTIDQLTLSIYKMFFFQGTESLQGTGQIKISPGAGKQMMNPKDMKFLEVPGPGVEAWKGLEQFKTDLNEASGITDPLIGNITGKTAFEIAVSKEAALKRLSLPLGNICGALEDDAYITLYLNQLIYSLPEVIQVSDPLKIEEYLQEIQSDPELYERDEEGTFKAKIYREFPLGLEESKDGNLIETKETKFFRIKPKYLKWEGIISIDAQSILTPSKELTKALTLEMYNLVIPLLVQPPEIYEKVARDILKLYDREPEDILPDMWLQTGGQMGQIPQQLILPQEQIGQLPASMPQPGQTSIPTTQISQKPAGIGGSLVGKFVGAIRRMGR